MKTYAPIEIGLFLQIGIGVSVVLSWFLRFDFGLTWGTDSAPMQMNTAIIQICLGVLGFWWSRTLAAIVVLLAAGALVETWIGTQILDELLWKHHLETASVHPGRMAPNTSLLGLAQLCATAAYYRGWHLMAAAAFSSTALPAMTFVAGYAFGAPIYHWGGLTTAMSLPTAMAFLVGTTMWMVEYAKEN